MSIAVPLEDLARHVAERGPGFLLSTTADSRPHVVQVRFQIDGGTGVGSGADRVSLRSEVGRSAVRNITAQSAVTLLWPPVEPGGYSLIVDAEGTIEGAAEGGAMAVLTPTGAVLHRPA